MCSHLPKEMEHSALQHISRARLVFQKCLWVARTDLVFMITNHKHVRVSIVVTSICDFAFICVRLWCLMDAKWTTDLLVVLEVLKT